MTATIDTVEVFGHNDNGKVKTARRVLNKEPANQRFKQGFKANRLLITGTNLNELDERKLKLTYNSGNYTFAVVEVVPPQGNVDNTQRNVYFVVWTDEKDEPKDIGDLTVTVETVAPTAVTGMDPGVTIED